MTDSGFVFLAIKAAEKTRPVFFVSDKAELGQLK